MIRNNQRRRRGGGNPGPRPQQMAGGNNYGARLDNRQRGNATQLLEKYRALARDAQQAGDRVTAEYYLQYAEHYFRLLGDHRDRPPEGRRGRDGYDDDSADGDNETAENDAGDDRDDGDERRDDRPREDRPREDRPREDRPREDRQREQRPRSDSSRDQRPREERPRSDRSLDDRPRDDRPREERPREERPKEERPRDDRSRSDWQRDRRDRRPERADQDRDAGGDQLVDERESLLQALPPPVSRPEGRRLGLRRDAAEPSMAPELPVTVAAAPDEAAAAPDAPKRRTRARKPVAEAGSAD